MTVANGDIIKAVFEIITQESTITQMILHFLAVFIEDQTNQDVLDAIEVYEEDLLTPLLAQIDAATSVGSCPVNLVEWNATQGLWETSELLGYTTPDLTFTGTLEDLPYQCAAVLVGNTTRPKSRGRKFIPCMQEGASTGSDWGAGILTSLATCLAAYLADETISGSNVLQPGVPRSAANTWLGFTDGSVKSTVGTQRRRVPGIGA